MCLAARTFSLTTRVTWFRWFWVVLVLLGVCCRICKGQGGGLRHWGCDCVGMEGVLLKGQIKVTKDAFVGGESAV